MAAKKKQPEIIEGEAMVVADAGVIAPVVVRELPKIVRQDNQYTAMLSAAIEKDLDITKLERIIAIQKEWDAAQAEKQFLLAHSRFQSEIPIIEKKGFADYGTNDQGVAGASYGYAKLEDIAEGIKPYLAPNGLSYRWDIGINEGIITVSCVLSHFDGHSISSTMIASPDTSGGKKGLHPMASARSYLKRYTLLDVAGVTVGGEDNDAEGVVEIAGGPETKGQSLLLEEATFMQHKDALIQKIKGGRDPLDAIKWLEQRTGCVLSAGQRNTLVFASKEEAL